MRIRMLSPIAAAMLVLAGCGGGHAASVPPAPVGMGVPAGYRAIHVWRADLSGQSVQDVVVASEGPPVTSQGFHSRDIRVLVWDPLAHQWTVAFDAQKVFPANGSGDPGSSNSSPGLGFTGPITTPLLDPKADVTLGSVRFVQLLRGLRSWSVTNRVLTARAEYWTPTNAHCCPVTSYRFTVAQQKDGFVDETSDSRPWIGAVVYSKNLFGGGPLRVTAIADKAPAAGRLRVGDRILNVLDAPKPPKGFPTYSIFDEVVLMKPGDTVRLLVERDGKRLAVPVKLGSMKASLGTFLPKTDYTYAAF